MAPPSPTTTTSDERRAHYEAYVADVEALCADNGTRARLRAGRGQPVTRCRELHRYLVCLVAQHGAKRAHYTVASLIALRRPDRIPSSDTTPHSADRPGPPASVTPAATDETAGPDPFPPWRSRPNLGASLAAAVRRAGFNAGRTEEHLHTLVRLETDQLHPRLPSLAERLLRAGIPIDWAVLLEDLAWWDYDRDQVSTRWLESYYLTLQAITLPQEP